METKTCTRIEVLRSLDNLIVKTKAALQLSAATIKKTNWEQSHPDTLERFYELNKGLLEELEDYYNTKKIYIESLVH